MGGGPDIRSREGETYLQEILFTIRMKMSAQFSKAEKRQISPHMF